MYSNHRLIPAVIQNLNYRIDHILINEVAAMKMIPTILIFFISSLTFNNPAYSEEYQSHTSIKSAVKQYLLQSQRGHSPTITISRIDKRLKLKECELPLEAFSPQGGRKTGNTSVGVRCNGEKPWTVYVTAYIKVFKKIIVAAKTLSRGVHLSADDVMLLEKEVGNIRRGYLSDLSQVIGKKLTRTVNYEDVITVNMVKAPITIKKGDVVNIISKSSALRVSMQGIALMNGQIGKTIRVKNKKSKKIIEGKVIAPGVVEVSR